jgi:AmmeMemoRadiSam system protein A
VKAAIAQGMGSGAKGLSTCACGEGAILSMMHAAKRMGATRAVAVSYANSGDTPLGEPGRVVGYGAVVFGKGAEPPDFSGLEPPRGAEARGGLVAGQRAVLLGWARRSIDQYLSTRTAPLPRSDDPALTAKQGAFVTLKRGGDLRGCIGHMAEDRPLCQVVGAMALQAAFNDRRFAPLSPEEWGDVAIEISVLTPRREVRKAEEIVVGRDGVVIEKGGRSAVFLPQVAPEQGWNREEMLEHLCAKAGLPGGCWREGARFFVFQAEVFGEEDAR